MSLLENIFIKPTLYVIAFIFSLLIFIGSLIYRIIIGVIVKIQHPDAVFLSSQDTLLSYGTSTDEKQLLYAGICNGTVDIELFRSIVCENVKTLPRAQSYVEEKYGYYFWMKEKNYDIEDHVLFHPDLSISTKKQRKDVQTYLYYNTSIPRGMSPWVIHFVPLNLDYEESHGEQSFLIVIIFYHALCDGYSGVYTFLKGLSDYDEPRLMVSNIPAPTFGQEVLMTLQTVFLVPYFVQEFFYKRSLFHQFARTGRQIYSYSESINTETVKTVKRAAGVPFFVVLLSCMMGALEKYFQKQTRKLPTEITVAIPQVLWKREDKVELKNNFILVYLNLTFTKKVGIERLKEIVATLKGAYTRNKYIAVYIISKRLANVIPSFFVKFCNKKEHISVLLSIAGVECYPSSVLRNRKVPNQHVKGMLSIFGNIGIVFQPITFGDKIAVSVHSRSTITTEEELDQMLKDFEEELHILLKDVS